MEWNNIVITCATVVTICAGILVVINLINGLKTLFKPKSDIISRLDKHDDYFARDNNRISRIEDDTSMLLKSQYALMLHFTTGNSVENLKKKQDELLTYLAERK